MCYFCEDNENYQEKVNGYIEELRRERGNKRREELSDGPRVQGVIHSADSYDWPDSVYNSAYGDSENDFELNAYDKSAEAVELLIKKHNDYGPNNIALSPGGPLNGLSVRLWDKVARLAHLLETGATPENESLYDTFMDINNYGLIGMLVLDGQWPDAKIEKKK
jgi:hypothetical protein